jgi:L-amino acid N-acyltransferase YncA
MIRSVHVEDAAQLCEIYNHYVLNTPITFEEEAVTVEDKDLGEHQRTNQSTDCYLLQEF